MTTIATDGQTIAADGLHTSEGLITARRAEKLVVEAGHVFAFAGQPHYFPAVRQWVLAGANPETAPKLFPDTHWAILVIGPDGVAREAASVLPALLPVELPYTMGSGRAEARAAMMAGASPRRAVEIAAQLDTLTGGEITVIDIAQALGIAARAPVRWPAKVG